MKTVHFTKVVDESGQPEAHFILTEPSKDAALQSALKSHRLMTVFQETVGTKADQGLIGYEPGSNRQYLIFPKSLKHFQGSTVVGIKYDLLASPKVEKVDRMEPPPRPKKQKPAIKTERKEQPKLPKQKEPPPPPKIVEFEASHRRDHDDEAIAKLKGQVRRAMEVLEGGKPVAAYNLLKAIVEG